MHIRLAGVGIAILGTLLFLLAQPAAADMHESPNKGLFVSPLRQYHTVDAGKVVHDTLTLANHTDKPIEVSLRVEKFSVTDYTYDFKFEATQDNWIELGTTTTQLAPGKSQQIAYSVTAPENSPPGGKYFTIFATTTFNGEHRVQAASVLYVTVNGPLDHSGTITKDMIPFFAFGTTIPYTLDVQNTGNDHFFIFLSGRLEGLTAKPHTTEAGHILMPNTTRTVEGHITAPVLPGVYKAIYGYKTSTGETKERSKYIMYIPPWSIAIPVGLGIIFAAWRRRARQ